MFEMSKNRKIFTHQFKDALIWDDPKLVQIFLQRYSVHGTYDYYKQTPLHLAAQYGSEKCIAAIIDFGYNVNDSDDCGDNPLDIAAGYEQIEAVQVLLKNDAVYSDASWDAKWYINNSYRNRTIVATLVNTMINRGLSIEDTFQKLDLHDSASYHIAVSVNNEELLQLVDKERHKKSNDIEVEKKYGIIAAIDDKNTKMILHMYKLGLSVQVKIENGHNLLTYAASRLRPDEGYVEVIKVLLQLRVDFNEVCKGLNAIQWVTRCGNVGALRVLLSYGANVLDKDNKNNTLLHLALQNNDFEVLRFLCRMPIDKKAKNLDNITALQLAKSLDKEEAVSVSMYD